MEEEEEEEDEEDDDEDDDDDDDEEEEEEEDRGGYEGDEDEDEQGRPRYSNWQPSFSCARKSAHMQRLCPCVVVAADDANPYSPPSGATEGRLPWSAEQLRRNKATGLWERPGVSTHSNEELTAPAFASPSALPTKYVEPGASAPLLPPG